MAFESIAPSLWIASGTPYGTEVIDLRDMYPWAKSTGYASPRSERYLIVHHTVTPPPTWRVVDEVIALIKVANTAPYGLPYNFVVTPPGTVYYINDVDKAWPHTLNYNAHTAIACLGDYDKNPTESTMITSLEQLLHALREMWAGQYECVVRAHREMPGNLTRCPGDKLYEVVKYIRDRW
jgi:hypothetical protein